MRIGILTFHRVPNFGAVLQAWSTVSELRRRKDEVEVIDYRAPANEAMFHRKGLRRFIPSLGAYRQKRFVQTTVPLSAPLFNHLEVENYINRREFDCLITGSDQVWRCDVGRRIDPVYFLGFDTKRVVRRVAYAPSCGDGVSFGEDSQLVTGLLRRFDSLSVRDANTMTVLSALGFQGVHRVLDPTFLSDFEPLQIPSHRRSRPYIGVFGHFDAAAERLIREIARETQLKVEAIGCRCRVADRERRFVSPVEWLSGLANSSYVITSLFHGTALAMKFRRPFFSVDCAGRRLKIDDLLRHFDMSERLLTLNGNAYSWSISALDMNYGSFESRLAVELEKSRRFLTDAVYG